MQQIDDVARGVEGRRGDAAVVIVRSSTTRVAGFHRRSARIDGPVGGGALHIRECGSAVQSEARQAAALHRPSWWPWSAPLDGGLGVAVDLEVLS